MAPEATVPHSDVNVPGDYFSLAGFEVTTYGRFWVTPEADTENVFPFKFTFTYETLFRAVQQLGNFDMKSVDVVGSYTWFNDKFKLIVFVPVNDSAQATKVSAELHKMYDFAGLMDFESSLLYFRPLPYEFQFKKYGEANTLLVYIN
jgi:hypothetical protein